MRPLVKPYPAIVAAKTCHEDDMAEVTNELIYEVLKAMQPKGQPSGGGAQVVAMPRAAHLAEHGEALAVPDVIVHRRGQDGPNVLVLELKKTSNPAGWNFCCAISPP